MILLQTDPDVNLAEIFVIALVDFLKMIKEWFINGLKDGYRALGEALFGTPTPQTSDGTLYGQPTNPPWTGIHDALVGGEILLVALMVLLISVQGRHTLRIFDFGSAYEARKTRKTAWVGAILIVMWYWVAVSSLYLIDGLTLALLPDISTLGELLLGFAKASVSNPSLGFLLAVVGGVFMFVFKSLLVLRDTLLFIYLYGMPIGIAIAFANLPVVSNIATGFAKKFVPLAVFPLPAALLFKGFAFLYEEGVIGSEMPSSTQLLIASVIPILAVWVTWVTFKWASPLTAKMVGKTATGAVTLGAIATGAYLAGPRVGATAARWGSKVATGQALAHRIGGKPQRNPAVVDYTHNHYTMNPSKSTDAYGQQGLPEYRRTENDPAYQ